MAVSPELGVIGQRRVRLNDGNQEYQYVQAPNYDVGPDGRFLMLTPIEGSDDILVTINWTHDQAKRWRSR